MFSKPSQKKSSQTNELPKEASEQAQAESPVDNTETKDSAELQIDGQFAELKSLIGTSNEKAPSTDLTEVEIQYRSCLMENISEGVIFVNKDKTITCWNKSAALITGLTSANMIGAEFTPGILGLTEKSESQCLVSQGLESWQQLSMECALVGKSGRNVNIELTVLPVVAAMQCHGAVILLKDLSANKDLKKQLSDLKLSTSLDPLTRVANRAEFDKCLKQYVFAHRSTETKCCLIMCDIDFFKMINDTYGHNVGDQALVAFAQALQEFVRSRDLVARYGGEEFVILCANCDLEHAVARAEEIRKSLNQTPQAMLDGKTLAASFGVAELKDDEDITEFFVRADQALYTAKENGRNRVEQAHDASDEVASVEDSPEESAATGVVWKKRSKGSLFCQEYITTTPPDLLADKLKGFILETDSKLLKIEPNYASVETLVTDRKNAYKNSYFRVDIEFYESENVASRGQIQTTLRITIFPPRQRMFRKAHKELHSNLVTDIRRFFMITEDSAMVTLTPAATSSGRD